MPADRGSPLVTIVTPSLDQGRYLGAAIDSVLAQDYERIEYLVMDGGSKDGTLEILRRYEDRLRFVSEPDAGQAAAINKGFALGRGEILGWLNGDDLYERGAVRRAVRCFAERPELMLVYGQARFVDGDGRALGPCDYVEPFDLERLLRHGDIVAQPAAFFRRSAFEAVRGLDESLRYAMDYDLWLKLGRRFAALHLEEPFACYRLTGENKSASGGEERFDEVERVVRRHGGRGLPGAFRLERLLLARRDALALARGGRPLAAAREIGRGLAAVAFSPRGLRLLLHALRQRLRSRHRIEARP